MITSFVKSSYFCLTVISFCHVYGKSPTQRCTWKILALFLNCTFFFFFPKKKNKKQKLWPPWLKGCVHYIFAGLFFTSKREHLWNKEECFLFLLKSFFRSWDNQILTFKIFKCHDVIKCPSMKHKTHFTEQLGK